MTDAQLIAADDSLAALTDSQLEQRLVALAAEVGNAAAQRNLMICTAESCTGGAIARALTEISGSSAWFDCGYVTYTNDAKQRMLGVPADALNEHGAVSEPVARAMAAGALAGDGDRISMAVTGVAGPGGGSAEKPVGTVWFGWAGPALGKAGSGPFIAAARVRFDGGRSAVRLQTAIHALRQLKAFWL